MDYRLDMIPIAVLLVIAIASVSSADPKLKDDGDGVKLLREIAGKSDSSLPPPNVPVDVRLGIYINSMFEISEQSMDFGVSWYMRMSWQDERLKFTPEEGVSDSIKAPGGYWDDIWTPDLFIRNEKSADQQSIITPHRLLNVNSTGHVWYVVKMIATLSCPMELHRFPMDRQACPVMFESFGYTMDTIVFSWLDSPVEIDRGNQIPNYHLVETRLTDCSQNYTAGAFPCLEVKLIMERSIGFYAMQVYIPSIILVIISWFQFYLRSDKVTARVLIGLFATFTLVAQLTGIRASLPKISYMTALDIWLTICLIFVFVTLLELALVQVISNRKAAHELSDIPSTSWIDVASRVIFPVVFAIFLIVYWAYYMNPELLEFDI